jgi:hypothetical protein
MWQRTYQITPGLDSPARLPPYIQSTMDGPKPYFTICGGRNGGYRSLGSVIFGGEHKFYGTTFVVGSQLFYRTDFELGF